MRQDRKKWNEKYADGAYSTRSSGIVQQFYKLAPKGRALDIAAGAGRNAIFLADKGFKVDAVDISDVAIEKLSGRHPNLQPICADLDDYVIPVNRYSLIVNIRFLNRRIFPHIREGLVPGGILIFETYLEDPRATTLDPVCRDYLLRGNELLHCFLALKILYYREATRRIKGSLRPTAALVAEKTRDDAEQSR